MSEPVVVVGHGLSAADALLFCLVSVHPAPVHHIFRIPARDLRSTMLGLTGPPEPSLGKGI